MTDALVEKHDAEIDAILANRGAPFQWRDPSNVFFQRQLGLSQRQIVNACKRAGWPWRKVYGRVWVCADFEQRWAESRPDKEAGRAVDIDT